MKRTPVTIALLVASALATVVLVATPASASSSPSARYGVVNATVDAATDHERGTSTAFPNFTNGAIDNYYSLAHSHIDNSPFAEGTASPADTGPLGQTAAAGNFQQPQYADARWPGEGGTASFGNAGGPSASASAASYKATALSSDLSDAGAAPMKIAGPSGFNRRLGLALAAWKARWLGPLGLATRNVSLTLPTPTVPAVTTPTVPGVTVPTPGSTTTTSSTTTTTSTTPAPSGPPANGALVSSTRAEIDPHSGAVVTSGRSSLGTVDIGGGQIVLKHVDVTVTITNRGAPKGNAFVSIGAAKIGGVPVTIDQTGVHVNGQGSGLPYAQADDALNAALKNAGVQLYTARPQMKKSANELTITATGVHVVFAQPVDQAGVPSQTVEHIVGEVFADSLAAPAGPVPSLSLGGPSSSLPGFTGGSTTGVSGNGTSFGSGSSSPTSGSSGPATGGSVTSAFTALLNKPTWLLVAYLVWQALMLTTGASLWRWRAGGVT